MQNSIFHDNAHNIIKQRIVDFLSTENDYFSPKTIQSPRAVGDAIQEVIADNFASFAKDYYAKYDTNFARRAMADLAFTDQHGNYYVVDVKTHREDTKFNMPNLTSVERISRFYEDDKNYFCVLMVKYHIEDKSIKITDVIFAPIEFLSWDCLTIGALGWGQIQIANSNSITLNASYSRKKWMLEFCDTMLEFYPKEILKITSRTSRFEEIKKFWEMKVD